MKHPVALLASLALSLLLSGCAAAAGSPVPSAPAQTAATAARTGEGTFAHHHDAGDPSPKASTGGPSEAARMVCGDQPMDRLTAILDLHQKPHTVSNWADNTFTCTYHLVEGALEISVQEAQDHATARTYFDARKALASDAQPIEGLANLGFPAFETAAGSAVFQKDSFVLQVDASGLPATVGPEDITRNALAYQLATTILACWVAHH